MKKDNPYLTTLEIKCYNCHEPYEYTNRLHAFKDMLRQTDNEHDVKIITICSQCGTEQPLFLTHQDLSEIVKLSMEEVKITELADKYFPDKEEIT